MEPIAIIGMGCRFPGAGDPESFWELLRNGVDAIREVPPARWELARFYDPDPEAPGRMNTRWGGFLDEVDRFDPLFFGISPREARYIDPQQRLLLEVTWEALEDAGLVAKRLAGTPTGVFIGISNSDYTRIQASCPELIGSHTGTGMAVSIAANRISYFLDLRGPSLAVDTACSSSLVAVHLACQALNNGECTLALAGGVNLLLAPEPTIALSKARMMAEDGRCKAFDSRADGYVRGEGAGIVMLKPLARALDDGDPVIAVILGSAVNQDGLTNGLSAPNPSAQEAVVREACRQAGVPPGRIQYVETHGTGTLLGDPMEVKSLGKVLGVDRPPGRTCLIGSVKTNIGHLESAAGIAGLIKVALALKHKEIPPSLHFEEPNPYIPFDDLQLRVQRSLGPWPETEDRALAGLSSFGFGGTNAHMVLAAAPEIRLEPNGVDRPLQLLALSAKGAESLRALAGRYARFFEERPGLSLADVCFTANAGRTHFGERLALTGASLEEMRGRLAAFAADASEAPALRRGAVKGRRRLRLAFLFSGQGSQYPHMGRELYETEPTFRKTLAHCDEILRPHLERPLLSVLYPEEKDRAALGQTLYTQPALFALEYALAALWRSWGIVPDLVMGHSVGEYTAACVAGAYRLEEALELVAARARLMQDLPEAGTMAAVLAGEAQVTEALGRDCERVSIAAVNGPGNTVISGAREAVEAASARLRSKGMQTRPLAVSHAFHSSLMEPALAGIEGAAGRASAQPLHLPMVSNLGGELLKTEHLIKPDHWRRHSREPVRFAAGIAALFGEGCDVFLEVGPAPVLLGMARECQGEREATWLPSLRRGKDDWQVLLDSLASLYVRGAEVDWRGLDRDCARRRVSLPTYPFERKRYWIDAGEARPARGAAEEAAPRPRGKPSSPGSRRQKILALLRAQVAELLWVDPSEVDPQTPFIELGADSVALIELLTRIESVFGAKLSQRQFYDELTTTEALAAYLDQTLPAEWEGEGEIGPAPQPVASHFTDEASPKPEGGHAGDRVEGASDARSALERLIDRQLDLLSRVMAQQLEALRQADFATEPAPVNLNPGPRGAPQPPLERSSRSGEAERKPASAERGIERSEPSFAPRADSRISHPNALQAAALGPTQRRHVETLVDRYTRRTERSKRFAERYRPVLADRRASAGFRFSIKEMLYPIVGARAEGSRIWDIDGNEYVDLTMGFGVQLFGHNPPFVREALRRELKRGLQLGPQARLCGEVAEAICELTGMERVTFCNSGTEAVMTALRLARAATGREKIALFLGSYHGHFDGTLAIGETGGSAPRTVPLAPGVPSRMVEDVLVLPYDSPESLEVLRARSSELAGVLVEPVQSRNPGLQPRAFLHELRGLTEEAGVPLIFDEVLTGFRVHPRGAQGWFGVAADIAAYGKLLGGGLPIGVVAGKAGYMNGIDGGVWSYGDASYPMAETTFFAGTFNKNPLVMATARAVLREIRERGPALQEGVNEQTKQLAETLNRYFAEHDVPIRIEHFGSIFRFAFKGNMDLLFYHLLEKGLYIWEGRTCFLSTAHGEEDLSHVVEAVRASIEEMRAGSFLPASAGPTAKRPFIEAKGGGRMEPHEAVRFSADGLEVRLAEDEEEFDQAFALRYRVFYEEMGARATPEMAARRRDFDRFDELCDHLLVIDEAGGGERVVGTYRLLRRGVAVERGGFYSAGEYDVSKLIDYPGEVLELGRACVASKYRQGPAMDLLWRGISAYALRHDVAVMFGCASFPGAAPQTLAEPLAYLYHYHLAPPALRPRALSHRYVDMDLIRKAEVEPRRAAAMLPPLIKGYLRLGARVGDGAVIDEQFNTTDVCVVLKTDWIQKP